MTIGFGMLRDVTAGALCLVLVGQPLMAAGAPAGGGKNAEDARVLHALNRFTFGPRPGDVTAVEKMGLKRWFDQQLDPQSIDDSALEARLANFPAMKLSQEALMQRFPSPQVLRMMERQDRPLPNDPTERVIYADQMAFYKMKQEQKAAKGAAAADPAMKPDAAGTMKAGMGTMDVAAAAPEEAVEPPMAGLAVHEEELYAGLDAMRVINLPADQRMQRILAMSPKELIAFRQSLSKRELAEAVQGLSPEQKEILAALPGSGRMVTGELLQSRVLRDVYSDRQLEAVMTDFWLNHFNIYARKNQNEPFLLPSFERDVIRPNALGHFEDLLVATAESPAMQMYLDNWQSIGPGSQAAQNGARRKANNPNFKAKASGLNENYARELMELHTLGVGGGYTQADVTQVAKVFTGWTIERPYQGAAFQFEPRRHEPGSKVVLGQTIRDGGMDEGLAVLHALATSPATARFISTKLAVRFVADEPPPALVDRMTAAFLKSKGDMKVVLRTMFDAPEFWSPKVYRAKVKTPLEFVVSAARASDAEIGNAQPLVQALNTLGMPLYGMQTPNGYSWMSEPWVSTGALVSRMNFALVLAGDRMPGVRIGLGSLLGEGGVQTVSLSSDTATREKERRLELFLVGEPVSERTRSAVLRQSEDGSAQEQAVKEFSGALGDGPAGGRMDRQAGIMAGLLLGSPEFQRR
ncbi:DUF1800 domain-containing protein [Granulicella arctica]|uniref:DUF1800 domain-containing protein n=1 Tax=Granulicella arctica TaxID=940613 RepID=UPI0021E09448|nr:DUF1800 domain-containing protein [Granulicella arctica]